MLVARRAGHARALQQAEPANMNFQHNSSLSVLFNEPTLHTDVFF